MVAATASESVAETATAAAWPELSKPWKVAAGLLAVGVSALMLGAFVNSFHAVEAAVHPSFGDRAWTIPLLVDIGIVVATGLDLLFTKLRLRVWWLRFIPWGLIGATIYLNVIGETSMVGTVAHAVAPLLWVVPVELAAHAIRTREGLDIERAARRQAGKLDRVRISRWLLAPVSTAVIRRQMVLQEERSYDDHARERWYASQEAKWALQDRHGGLLWRVRATRRERGLYRWGHLTAELVGQCAPGSEASGLADCCRASAGADTSLSSGPDGAGPAADSGPNQRPVRSKPRRPRKHRAKDLADLMPAVEREAAELQAAGRRVTKESLGDALRASDWRVSNERVGEALQAWRARTEQAGGHGPSSNGRAAGSSTALTSGGSAT